MNALKAQRIALLRSNPHSKLGIKFRRKFPILLTQICKIQIPNLWDLVVLIKPMRGVDCAVESARRQQCSGCKDQAKNRAHTEYLVTIRYPLTSTTNPSETGKNTFHPRRIS